MLELLHIENIAVIESADIAFQPGFNALTGETGAGKSIVIDAMGAVLGGRASRELIRTGASKAFVSAVFSHVSEKLPGLTEREMALYRRLRLPRWKDRLPQFNPEFDKRHLATPSPAYLRQFLEVTCHAEVIHELIALLGFLSLFFCLLCEHPQDWLPLFFGIALFIGLCNLPFAAIQRYNRFRLVRLLRRMEAKTQVRS